MSNPRQFEKIINLTILLFKSCKNVYVKDGDCKTPLYVVIKKSLQLQNHLIIIEVQSLC